MVNGPKGLVIDLDAEGWDAIDWRTVEEQVRRLRGRIFKAVREGDWPKVRNLQKLMLRSWANTLLGVRRVTQHNAGRKTAGVDGEVALDSADRAHVARRVHATLNSWTPHAVKRVHIPKSGNRAKLRPLGIPVIMDRCHQARVRNALEPEWEARFEPRSYGFRPGRGCHDAIESIFTAVSGKTKKRMWILDADLAAAFDRIDHDRLIQEIGMFPARELIRAWLKAGVFETGKGFSPTEEGTPQGGVISPLLLNIALHGLEEAAGVRYRTGRKANTTVPDCPIVVRYADDLVALCHSQAQALHVKTRLAEWLRPRGLRLNEDKTNVVHLTEGFDFLGVNVRRYPNGKLIIKPSASAVRRLKRRLATQMRALRGSNAQDVIMRLNPIIRGWAAYYRSTVASRTFTILDNYMWRLLYKWAQRIHPNKSRYWIFAQYFGAFNKFRNDQWVFGDRNNGAYLYKFAWTNIVRHVPVTGTASPDDPALAEYWAKRRQRIKPPIDAYTLRLLTRQDARCPLCGAHLLTAEQPPQSPDQWERWWLQVVKRAIATSHLVHHGQPGPPNDGQTRLVHATCHRKHRTRQRRGTALQSQTAPRGLLEPCAATSGTHGSEGGGAQ